MALGQLGDAITAGQFTGEEAPPRSYFEGLVAAIGRRWLEDGKPKAIVRVPPMQGGRSGEQGGSDIHGDDRDGAGWPVDRQVLDQLPPCDREPDP